MCDIAYVVQLEDLRAELAALRNQSLKLDPKDRQKIPTVADVQAEFDAWLAEEFDATPMTPEDLERAELRELMLGR